MEIVGGVGADVGGQPRRPQKCLLRKTGLRSRGAERVAGEEAADIDLSIGGRLQLVPTIARHEVPLGRKIVVHAPHCELAGRGLGNVGRESLNVRIGSDAGWSQRF